VTARRSISPFVAFLRRSVAAGCAALVLLLATLAASPRLHERFHRADNVSTDDNCAVTLFASGISLACAGTPVPLPQVAWVERPTTAPAEIFVATPRFLRLPERGPPAS
jgi:hypothetical protein